MGDGERQVTASAVNRGRGVAREARLVSNNVGPLSFLSPSSDQAEFGEKLRVQVMHGPEADGDGSFTLSWYQEPKLHRKRTKVLKYTLRALPDPSTRRGRRR